MIDSGDVHKSNNPWPMAEWSKKAPGIDWTRFLRSRGPEEAEPIVFAWQPDAIRKMSGLVASEPLQAWKDYLRFHAINHGGGLLPKAYAELGFGFYGTTLQGTAQRRDRWKRGIGATNGELGDAVGKVYVNVYFPASSQAQVEDMVDNIVAAFGEGVAELEWMTPETKEVAQGEGAADARQRRLSRQLARLLGAGSEAPTMRLAIAYARRGTNTGTRSRSWARRPTRANGG